MLIELYIIVPTLLIINIIIINNVHIKVIAGIGIVLLVVLGKNRSKQVVVPVLGQPQLILLHLCRISHLAFTLIGVKLTVQK
jgi:hypothetical protein